MKIVWGLAPRILSSFPDCEAVDVTSGSKEESERVSASVSNKDEVGTLGTTELTSNDEVVTPGVETNDEVATTGVESCGVVCTRLTNGVGRNDEVGTSGTTELTKTDEVATGVATGLANADEVTTVGTAELKGKDEVATGVTTGLTKADDIGKRETTGVGLMVTVAVSETQLTLTEASPPLESA